jgi:hypothetical protein
MCAYILGDLTLSPGEWKFCVHFSLFLICILPFCLFIFSHAFSTVLLPVRSYFYIFYL